MEAIILMGIQASGKSTFYQQQFFKTHMRLNLDMLKTRRRLNILLRACLQAQQRFVVDNTNLEVDERSFYIQAAKRARYQVMGYFFPPDPQRAMAWNTQRQGKERVPDMALWSAIKHLEMPTLAEGFDALYTVSINEQGHFITTGLMS